jgi:membrane protein YqaA with SNARE-associated domain
MHLRIRHFLAFFLHLGAFGLFIFGILDSSFFFLPVGNDLLLIVLVARHHELFPLYVLAAAAGSTVGVLLLDAVTRKGGEQGLKKIMSAKLLDYLKNKMSQRAGVGVVIACVSPPPFPFTPVIAVASAFQYPKVRLLGFVFGARVVRFSLVGLAALRWGRRILGVANSPAFIWIMVGFTAMCLIGSVVSVIHWIRVSHSQPRVAAERTA